MVYEMIIAHSSKKKNRIENKAYAIEAYYGFMYLTFPRNQESYFLEIYWTIYRPNSLLNEV